MGVVIVEVCPQRVFWLLRCASSGCSGCRGVPTAGVLVVEVCPQPGVLVVEVCPQRVF